MTKQRPRFLFLLALTAMLLVLPQSLFAAIIVDPGNTGANDVYPASPATWDSSTRGVIGKYNTGSLLVDNGSNLLSFTARIAGGFDSTGTVTVDGPGSTWTNDRDLEVGSYGNGTLNITNGASVSNISGQIGSSYFNSVGTVMVDGPGSTWTNSDEVEVGHYGNGTLNITNGASVNNTSGEIGSSPDSVGTVTVDAPGSTWTNDRELQVGGFGNGTLNITNGASVSNTSGRIGFSSSSVGTVTVDGPGSTWTNSDELKVGDPWGTGTLNITNGGLVSVAGKTSVGSHGTIHFDGGTLQTASLSADIACLTGTGTLIESGLIAEKTLVIDGPEDLTGYNYTLSSLPNQSIAMHYNLQGQDVVLGAGGTGSGSLTITNGMAITSKTGYIGQEATANGTMTVDGPGSAWTNSGSIYVGNHGSGILNITNGGVVNSHDISYIGNESEATGTVTVDGSGSAWNNDTGLLVGGYNGQGTLNILSGGTVSSATGRIGSFFGGTSMVTVQGNGSTWTNTYYLSIANGTLQILDGGTVSSKQAWINSSSTATVDGSGSTWTAGRSFSVNGTLNVSDGGSISVGETSYIGGQSGSTGTVTIDGTGSAWTSTGSISIGSYGNGTLNLTNGGIVSADKDTFVARYHGSTGSIHFGANGGTLTTENFLGSSIQLTGTGTINTCGLVSDVDLVFDNTHGLTRTLTMDQQGQNVLVHMDVSSTQDTQAYLGVGYLGVGTMAIRDSMTVFSKYGYLGYHAESSGTATVDGVGSTWNTIDDLYVGYNGNGELDITNGGTVSVGKNTYLAARPGSTGSINFGTNGETLTTQNFFGSSTQLLGTGTIHTRGLVSDVDLLFDATHGPARTLVMNQQGQNVTLHLDVSDSGADLGVGYLDTGSLAISDGVSVSSRNSYLGYHSGSNGTATVNGTGTMWETRDRQFVGYAGGGTLHINNTGTVSSRLCDIGYNPGSSGVVTVNGIGSIWNNNALQIGYAGNGTLDITNGANVETEYNAIIGYSYTPATWSIFDATWSMYSTMWSKPTYDDPNATGSVTVDGADSTWTILEGLTIGYEGNGSLLICNGGTVVSSSSDIGYDFRHYGIVPYDPDLIRSATVTGAGSTWRGGQHISVNSGATLNITDGGFVDAQFLSTNDDGCINMSTGGMLALQGEADDLLLDFLDLIGGTDAIRYWNDSISDWANITGATFEDDYTLNYLTEGDLTGYTLLTVGSVPVPGDANGDGRVDGSDVAVLAGNWQVGVGNPNTQTVTWKMGDFNRDGQIDGSDIAILAGNWQHDVTNSASPVPEPSTIVLLLTALVGWFIVRRR